MSAHQDQSHFKFTDVSRNHLDAEEADNVLMDGVLGEEAWIQQTSAQLGGTIIFDFDDCGEDEFDGEGYIVVEPLPLICEACCLPLMMLSTTELTGFKFMAEDFGGAVRELNLEHNSTTSQDYHFSK